jgi:Right handed beta helix region
VANHLLKVIISLLPPIVIATANLSIHNPFQSFMRLLKPVLCSFLLAAQTLAPVLAAELWISPGGNDANPGTPTQPLASLLRALQQASALSRSGTIPAGEPLKLILNGGTYPLATPLVLSPDDFANSNSISIESAPGQNPVLSGGIAISGWKKSSARIPGLAHSAKGNIWVANAPKVNGKVLAFRQLWVNGQKAVWAREPNGETMSRLLGWDKTNQVAIIPASLLVGVRTSAPLQMVIDQVWEIANLRVKNFRINGDRAFVTFQQPESRLEFQHPWPPIIVNSNYAAPFYLVNALPFLDSPGEWFEDVRAGKIYYLPRAGEDLATAQVVAPVLQTLVQVDGSLDHPVANIRFSGITFSYTTWLRPSENGHVPLQAGMFFLDAHKLSPRGTPYHLKLDNVAWVGRPPAAVSVQNANDVVFERCRFEHTASAGLDFISGDCDALVEGCVFQDIGGNGIQLGKFSDTNVETHLPYNPADQRELCARDQISNNLISDCGAEDWGCVGICVGYAREIQIEHNEVFDLPYTGISVGWGWTKATNALGENYIMANRVHDVGQRLGDLGGIYTLSAQPGTVVADNAVSNIQPSPFVPDPQHWFYLYADEGSSFMTFRDNWCPSEKFLRNANGPGNTWTNNGPQVSDTIKNAAGLESAYRP